jgi:LysM repeat protein
MKKSWVVGIIVGVHVVGIGALVLMPGCGTTRSKSVGAPQQPVMPPTTPVVEPVVKLPEPLPASIPEQPVVAQVPVKAEPKYYVIKSGDSLALIAKRFNVSVKDIVSMNHIANPGKIKPGQKLLLPDYVDLSAKEVARKSVAKPAVKAAPKSSRPKAVAGEGEYIVKSGDMLSSIAYRQGTSVRALKDVNNLTSDRLRVGQKLVLPKGAAPRSADEPTVQAPDSEPLQREAPEVVEPPMMGATDLPVAVGGSALTTHMVEPNQNLNDIAMMYGVRVDELMKANNLSSAEVKAGQMLKIPSAGQ